MAPGGRVTLNGPNCWEWVVAYDAIAMTGAVVNPISSMLTSEEVGYVVRDSGARVLSGDKGRPLRDLGGTDLSHLRQDHAPPAQGRRRRHALTSPAEGPLRCA